MDDTLYGIRDRKGEYRKEFLELRKQGFQRVKVDGQFYEIEDAPDFRLRGLMLDVSRGKVPTPESLKQLIDLCGIDYASFGEGEWKTEDATGTGFSRGVNATTAGRMTQLDQELSVDGPPAARRFAAVYQLLSVSRNQRLRMRVFADDAELPVIPSVIEIWNSVNWYEREAFDLFGILFEGHPDLRRILTDYGFVGHPFRKDFPLTGNVEVRYDPEKQRVVYQPVSIEPRVLVPKVIRPETRGGASEPAAESQD